MSDKISGDRCKKLINSLSRYSQVSDIGTAAYIYFVRERLKILLLTTNSCRISNFRLAAIAISPSEMLQKSTFSQVGVHVL